MDGACCRDILFVCRLNLNHLAAWLGTGNSSSSGFAVDDDFIVQLIASDVQISPLTDTALTLDY